MQRRMTCPTSSHGISKRRPIYACFAAAMVLRARARTKSATRSRPASQNNLIVGSRQARLSNSPVSRSLDPINMAASHALPKGKAAHRAVLDEPRGCVLVSGASSSPDYGKRTTVESSLYSQNCLGATSRCYRVSSPVPIRPARTLGSAKGLMAAGKPFPSVSPSRRRLLPFSPAIPTQSFQDQRMVRNLSRRPLHYSGSPVRKVEPRFCHRQQARLIDGVRTAFCKCEAVGRKGPILVTLTHGVKSPTFRPDFALRF
jgi:hypothetical protein